jgi:thiol-disulfide isomerase/thioredoxin
MTREVYTDAKFIEFSKSQVFIRVMEDKSDEGKRLANKYKIEGTPTLIIFDPSGKEIDRLVGGRGVQSLIEDLKKVFQSTKSEKYKI